MIIIFLWVRFLEPDEYSRYETFMDKNINGLDVKPLDNKEEAEKAEQLDIDPEKAERNH